MSTRGPPSSPPAAGRPPKSESEDSGVETASNEHSPRSPLGSESRFSLDGFSSERPPKEEQPPGDEQQPPKSRPGSRRLLQAAQRSRRQRCPRQLSRRSASAADLAEPPRDPEWAEGSPRDPRAVPELPGQGLRYLEHVCQMLERLARLQQDNRALRQQAAGARTASLVRARAGGWRGGGAGVPAHTQLTACPRSARPQPGRQQPRRDLGTWRGEGFRQRSCSDSQAPGERGGLGNDGVWGQVSGVGSGVTGPGVR
ncbi:uncharacterized protein C8orf58 homolog isoform X1 [Melospiza georgiana]|uniref:uncharacterized protein C8orf58 homolog isoform X1 n=1 Tax=Melospiza georgiana TaxID=44398 RepID=UPI0025AC970C|nr:uncharacterized protein C8orf58 homolog isoform X1 [Melospiza georgiana]